MSRDQIKLISSYMTLSEDVIIHWGKHGGDIELLFKQVQSLGYLMGIGSCNLPWQHAFLMPTGKIQLNEKFIADCVDTPTDPYGNTVAHYAALIGNVALLEAIYSKDPRKLLETTQHGFSVAHFAAFSKDGVSVLAWLSNTRELADLPKTPPNKNPAIFVLPAHIAARSGYAANLIWLKENHPETVNADLNSRWYFDECSLLDHALLSGNPDMPNITAELLGIQSGANLCRSATKVSLDTLSTALRRAPRLFDSSIFFVNYSFTGTYPADTVENYNQRMKVVNQAFTYHAFMFLLPLTQGVREHNQALQENKSAKTTLRITVDVFWHIAHFLMYPQYVPLLQERIFKHGFFNGAKYKYQPDDHTTPSVSVADNQNAPQR